MTQQNTMDEALALPTLRSIIAQALQECTPPSAEGTTTNSNSNNNIETSSDPSNISSLSGVYSQEVQQQQQQSRQKYKEERERLLDIALEIERSVADLESVVHTDSNHDDRALNNNNNDVSTATTTIDIIESLVALLTTVPNALLTKLYNVEYASGQIILRNDNNTAIVRQQQRHHNHGNQYVSSMEEICFNTACISCEILRMYIVQDLDGSFIDSLMGGGYTREFIDRLIHYLCSSDDDLLLGRNIRYPIIQVMNTIVEQREMERTLLLEEERGYNNNIDNHDFFEYYDIHHHHRGLVVFHMSAKDTLRLLQMLLRWIMGGRGGARGITGGSISSSNGVDESQYSHV